MFVYVKVDLDVYVDGRMDDVCMFCVSVSPCVCVSVCLPVCFWGNPSFF